VFLAQSLKTPKRLAGEFGVFYTYYLLKTGVVISYLGKFYCVNCFYLGANHEINLYPNAL
jgi:hypothetical protein